MQQQDHRVWRCPGLGPGVSRGGGRLERGLGLGGGSAWAGARLGQSLALAGSALAAGSVSLACPVSNIDPILVNVPVMWLRQPAQKGHYVVTTIGLERRSRRR